jgi:hypothetical protein
MKKDILVNGVIVGSYDATGNDLEDIKAVDEWLKEKGIHEEGSQRDQMHGQANAFAHVANDLYKKGLSKSPFDGKCVSPFVVNATFSIELYLKTIHFSYGNKIRGHHLGALFKDMPKQGIEHYLQASEDIKHKYDLKRTTDIQECLEYISKAFEEWRYIYEYNEIGIQTSEIRFVLHVSHEASCRVYESTKKT